MYQNKMKGISILFKKISYSRSDWNLKSLEKPKTIANKALTLGFKNDINNVLLMLVTGKGNSLFPKANLTLRNSECKVAYQVSTLKSK